MLYTSSDIDKKSQGHESQHKNQVVSQYCTSYLET